MMSELGLSLISGQPEPLPVNGLYIELRSAVLNGVAAVNSRRNYALALDELSAFRSERQQPVSLTPCAAHRLWSAPGRAAAPERRESSTTRGALGPGFGREGNGARTVAVPAGVKARIELLTKAAGIYKRADLPARDPCRRGEGQRDSE